MYDFVEINLDQIRTIRAEEIEKFNPTNTSAELKPIVKRHFKDMLTIARTLFIAHQFYSEIGKEVRALNLVQISEVDLPEGLQSFQEFCEASNIARKTAYRYLEKFVPGSTPDEDRLLTPAEITELKAERRRQEELRVTRAVASFRRTQKYPPDWDAKCEHRLEQLLLQERISGKVTAEIEAGKNAPQQLEFNFDDYIESEIEKMPSLQDKLALAEDLISRIRRVAGQYVKDTKGMKI